MTFPRVSSIMIFIVDGNATVSRTSRARLLDV